MDYNESLPGSTIKQGFNLHTIIFHPFLSFLTLLPTFIPAARGSCANAEAAAVRTLALFRTTLGSVNKA